MPSTIEWHQRTLNKDFYGLWGLQHTGVCQEAVCTPATFECADLKCCCFTFWGPGSVNKLFEGLLWPIHLLLWGFFVRNLSLGKKPRNCCIQLVHYDGKDELRNSAVIKKKQRKSRQSRWDFSCLKQFLANWFSSLSQVSGEAATFTHRTESDIHTRTCRLHRRAFGFFSRLSWPSG